MSAGEYNRRIQQAVQLLEGRSKQLLREMTAEMEAEAEALHFEQAAALRDRIHAIGALSKKQTVIAGVCADTDIWGCTGVQASAVTPFYTWKTATWQAGETELFDAPMEETEEEMLSP